MGYDFELAALVLLAALLHATWNALVKTGGDPLSTAAMVGLTGTIMCAAALPSIGLPARPCWPFLALSIFFHAAYYVVLVQAYRLGDLSYVYPIARGLPPLIVALLSGAVAGEELSGAGLAGAVTVSAGITSLALTQRGALRCGAKPLVYAVATGVIIAAYTMTDALGVRRAGAPFAYIAWLFFFDGIPITLIALTRRGSTAVKHARMHWRRGALGGVMNAIAYSLVLWAMSRGAIAPVVALRETSVIFATIIGTAVLGEPFGRRRLLAGGVVAVGVMLIYA